MPAPVGGTRGDGAGWSGAAAGRTVPNFWCALPAAGGADRHGGSGDPAAGR
jgi:hypothetical protein